MKNAKLSVAIVMMCIVCPIILGYAMPAEETEITDYDVGKTISVSGGMNNTSIPAYGPYSGVLNNMFSINTYMGQYMLASSVETTTAVGAWPSVEYDSSKAVSITGPTVTYSDLIGNITEGTAFAVYTSAGIAFTYNGQNYSHLAIFPSTQQMYLYNTNVQSIPMVNVTGQTLGTNPNGITGYSLYMFTQKVDSSGNLLYSKLSSGATISSHQTQLWANTYENSVVNMIVKCEDEITFGIPKYGLTTGTTTLSLTVEDGSIYAAIGDTNHKIGSASAYPYVLIVFDATNDTVEVSGLTGMTSFTDDYTASIGYSNSFDVEFNGGIGYIQLTGDGAYYVPSVTCVSGSTDAMKDATLIPTDYLVVDYWAMSIRGTAIYGDSITLSDGNGHTAKLKVVDGRIQPVESLGLNQEIPVLGLTIEQYTNNNGETETTLNGIVLDMNVSSITFDGTWNTALYLSELNPTTHMEYSWMPGNFGLDQTGFCMAGMISAFCMFLAVALYGRVSGEKTAIALIVSGICGAVFLILM